MPVGLPIFVPADGGGGLPAEEALPWNAPAPSGDRRQLHLGPGFATISSSLIFALREREIHLRFFGSKKAPVAISPRFLTVSSQFLLRCAGGAFLICALMKSLAYASIVAALFAAVTLSIQPSAQADTFGASGNEFNVDFVNIGNAGNAADTTTYGAVPYEYRASIYEISQDAITKATASGMSNVTAGAWTGNQPAANISWYEAAAFVNFLNTNSAKTAAYDLTFSNGSWSMALWSSEQAWTAGGTNLYRNKDAFYFLPSENEWYKAAYYNPAGSNYFLYPTASSNAPTAVASGTNAGSAVYNNVASVPALVESAGGLSPYGTMGQGGNVWEWNESAFDGTNNLSSEDRAVRGGAWDFPEDGLRSSDRSIDDPTGEHNYIGFRVASVPEPSTYVLVLLGAGAVYIWKRRKSSL